MSRMHFVPVLVFVTAYATRLLVARTSRSRALMRLVELLAAVALVWGVLIHPLSAFL